MKKLTQERFNKAAQFLKTQAQDIDKAMFEYFFEHKPLDEVIDILATYQNEDGGFGKLDYDIQYPYSCLKHTESACRYIFALQDIPAEHPLIRKVIHYIIKNYNEVNGEWKNITVPEVNDYPHAPWWGYGDSEKESEDYIPKHRADLVEHYDANTNATLAGILVKYSSLVPKELLDLIMDIVIEKINSGYSFYQYEMMSVLYFVHALDDENLKNGLLKTLMGNGKLISILDGDWRTENAYKLCHWINSPAHPYYNMYSEDIEKNLKYLIGSQEEDGSWSPSWSWGEPDIWERVKICIKGELTFTFLLALKNFNYI